MISVNFVRNLGVLSVLLLGVSPLAANAGNYVPQQSYNNPGVVVNMDVIGNDQGMARAPVLQQPLRAPMAPNMAAPLPPLRPPVLRRPTPQQFAAPIQQAPRQQPITMVPPPMSASSMAPAPMAPMPLSQPYPQAIMQPPQQPMQQPPMEIVAPLPPVMPPQAVSAPIASAAPMPIAQQQAAPSPIWDSVPAVDRAASIPQPESKMVAAPMDPVPMAPFSTRELAASAEPLPLVEPSPIAENAPEVKTEEKAVRKTAKAEMKKESPRMDPAQFAEAAVAEEATPQENTNPARQLLAQAREQAGDTKHEERKVVLFDNPPPAPSAQAPLKEIEQKETKTAEKLKPAPLAAPVDELQEPAVIDAPVVASVAPVLKPAPIDEPKAAVAANSTLKPAALPEPITKNEVITAPMAIVPVAKAPALTREERVAMLKPSALPDVAPASIPMSPAVKKAETVVDDFEAYRLLFSPASAQLNPTEQEVLNNIIGKLKQDENIKLQLRAYANGTPDISAQARRLSLARALAVRSYLTQAGIGASRMDVRALGMGTTAMNDKATSGNVPADRVDLIFTR